MHSPRSPANCAWSSTSAAAGPNSSSAQDWKRSKAKVSRSVASRRTRRFFGDGKLSRKRWKQAQTEVAVEFQQFAGVYRALGWQEAMGSSGTIKAIGDICASMKLTKGAVTAQALPAVRDRLLQAETLDAIDLPGLSSERRPIIAGGLLALEAAFDVLGLERMVVSKAALREGALYDMLGRGGAHDPRDASIAALMERYGIDAAQAARVEATALHLFDQVTKPGACPAMTGRCWHAPRGFTNSASPSPTASTTCTAHTCSKIRTSRASRKRNSACSRRWCARIGAAFRRAPSNRFPIVCSPRRSAPRRCCASRSCSIARTRPT